MTHEEAITYILSDLSVFLEATEDAFCEALTTDAQIADWNSRPLLGRDKKIEAAKAERDMANKAGHALLVLARRHMNPTAVMTIEEKAIGRLMAHFVEKAAARMAEGVR